MALTVAVQRFGGDPVWRGRVVKGKPSSQPRHPVGPGEIFGEALDLALELVCGGGPVTVQDRLPRNGT